MTRSPNRKKYDTTPNEKEILMLNCMADGMTLIELAAALQCSRTAAARMSSLFRKRINVNNNSQAVAWAFRNKYLI